MTAREKSTQAGQTLVTATILERGHKALRDALGDAGAIDFLRQMSNHSDDQQKRTLMGFDVDRANSTVLLTFSRPTVEVTLSVDEAKQVAQELYGRAVHLTRTGST